MATPMASSEDLERYIDQVVATWAAPPLDAEAWLAGTIPNTGPSMKPEPVDPNCLSFWFPVLKESGVPVPRTEIVRTLPDVNGWRLSDLLGGEKPPGLDGFMARLTAAAQYVAADAGGWPVFMRTGHISGKHDWRHCCYLAAADEIPRNLANLVERSEGADIFGLPTDVWVVREMLKVEPLCTLPLYGGFPLVRELRGFVRDGRLQCLHAYWPGAAIYNGLVPRGEPSLLEAVKAVRDKNGWADDWLDVLVKRAGSCDADDILPVLGIFQTVAKAFRHHGGQNLCWSVDVMETVNGWVVTDMALGNRSEHDQACPFSQSAQGRKKVAV